MSLRHAAAVGGSAVLLFGTVTAAVIFALHSHGPSETSLLGAVITQDSDPRKEMPMAGVSISASSGSSTGESQSDSSGFFRLTLRPGVREGLPVRLHLQHPETRPLDLTIPASDRLLVLRMSRLSSPASATPRTGQITIGDVGIRYTVKEEGTVNVATAVQTFEARNQGNVPCKAGSDCSPDGRWKAALGSARLDAGQGNYFKSIRVSCIAGPCPFTRVEADALSEEGRILNVSALNWSDTATFLVQADVVHRVISDTVRQAFPVIFGHGMSFSLPPTAAGPSILAELNGTSIVFPLGPDLLLSWATCTYQKDHDGSHLYSCELKPGYRFNREQ